MEHPIDAFRPDLINASPPSRRLRRETNICHDTFGYNKVEWELRFFRVAIIGKTENRAELTVPSNACKTDDLRASKLLPSYGPFSKILYHPQYIVFLAGPSYRYIEGNEISKVL